MNYDKHERWCPTCGYIEEIQPTYQQITERGKAVIESGLTVRQAHEIRTGCSSTNPCVNCRRYLT